MAVTVDGCAGMCCVSVGLTARSAERVFNNLGEGGQVAQVREMLRVDDARTAEGSYHTGNLQFNCQWFKDGRCTNYENRPRMCADYPSYGNPENVCHVCGLRGN